MADSYISSGALMRCSMGDKTAKLTVLPSRTVYLCGEPMANITDHITMVNLAPLGKCRSLGYPLTASATAAHHGHLTPMPCSHNTPANWIQGKTDYYIKGQPALLKSSKCQCMWGGIISFVNDGQVGEGTSYVQKKEKESKEVIIETSNVSKGLSVDSILDGIQTALDLAGFVPGVGAIPDLINAAIYVMRGDMINAGLSLVSAVPGIGDAAGAAKILNNGLKFAKKIDNVGSATTRVAKTSENIVSSVTRTAKTTEKSVATTRVAKTSENIASNAALTEKTTERSVQLSEKQVRRESVLKNIDSTAEHGASDVLCDAVPTNQGEKNLLEIVKYKANNKTTSGFEDLTPGDRFEIEEIRAWEMVKNESNTSSFNPFTLKEASSPLEVSKPVGDLTEAKSIPQNNIYFNLETPNAEKAKKILNIEEAEKVYKLKKNSTHILDIEI